MSTDIILQAKNLKKYYGKGETEDAAGLIEDANRRVIAITDLAPSLMPVFFMLGGASSDIVAIRSCHELKSAKLTSCCRWWYRIYLSELLNLIAYAKCTGKCRLSRRYGRAEAGRRIYSVKFYSYWDWNRKSTVCRIISPAASSSVWRLRGPSPSKPDIILADEPTGNLDSRTSDNVIALLHMTSRKFHQTITAMITHNPEIAQMTDRMIRIEDGRIIS